MKRTVIKYGSKNYTILTVNLTRHGGVTGVQEQVNVLKLGRKVVFTQSSLEWLRGQLASGQLDHEEVDKNLVGSAKGIARLLERALDGKDAYSEQVESDYDSDEPSVSFTAASKRHIDFTAPCGARGYLTVNEATKLAAALREEF